MQDVYYNVCAVSVGCMHDVYYNVCVRVWGHTSLQTGQGTCFLPHKSSCSRSWSMGNDYIHWKKKSAHKSVGVLYTTCTSNTHTYM